ncbi:MAG TPA: serine/threonine-protein kinase [Candidatus Paceibacterota bacterium]|nr:serine/threonine-protein kinase [Verrucomicrobiota bacterium]HSA11139.1 serine/threonine-protein kinase [Candidatus Paceibacterota bacterium]
MDTEHICPSCRKPLPAGAPQGLCPECLMKAGFGSGVAPEPGQPSRTPAFVPPAAAEMARLFPQFEIMELLGQGGMGAVYKARQPALDRLVALKILPPETGPDTGFADRFTREARALARLSHPNIVAVHEFGQAGGLHYFVMEYVEGLNLRQLQQAGRLAPREALKIIPQICDALQFAHDEGIVHRDIKPENVMLDTKGRVKITDFGLAKILGREPTAVRLTGARDVMGTPHYMAPEQIEHPQEVDHRADIYSLGVVFYEMLTGELPLGKFQAPSKKVQVDVRLDEVVLHALEKEPERRYQQASQVKTDVETIGRTPPSADIGPKEMAELRRHLLVKAGCFAFAALCFLIATFSFAASDQALPAVLSVVATVFLGIAAYRHFSGAQRCSVESTGSSERRSDSTRSQGRGQGESAALERARRLVKWPAIGLITTSLLGPFMLGFLITIGRMKAGAWMFLPLVLQIALIVVTVLGSYKLLHLESHRWAIAGGIAGCAGSFLNFLCLPFAVWSLAAANRRDVRDLFGKVPVTGARGSPGAQHPARAWKLPFEPAWYLGIIAGLALVAGLIAWGMWERRFAVSPDAVVHIEEELARELKARVIAADFGVASVSVNIDRARRNRAECLIGGLVKYWGAGPQEPGRQRMYSEVAGGGVFRHEGSGLWSFVGNGALQKLRFHVTARATTYHGQNAFEVQQKLGKEVVRYLEAEGYRWDQQTLAIHYFINPDVAECTIEGLRKLVGEGLESGSKTQLSEALSGELDIRHSGKGLWAVQGSGDLTNVTFTVDTAAEMGPLRFPYPTREDPDPATRLVERASKSRPPARSQFPKDAHIGGGNYSVMVYHDDVDLHYALFYAGEFSSTTQGSRNSRSQAWTDDGSLKLKSGRTFGYLRESPRPDRLRINGKEYNLRQGRVFALSDDGNVAQMALFPPLEVARDPQQLAGLVASSDASLPFSQARPGQFKVSLTNGLEFEVLAVASSPRSSSVWWRPDGTLLPEAPGDRLGAFSTLCPDRRDGTEFALLTRRAGEFVPETELLLGFEPRPHYVTCTDLYQGSQAKGRVTLIGFLDVVPGSLICKIGLADGAWERVATWDQAGVLLKNESGSTVRLIRSGADDQTCLKLDHNLDPRKFALRLAARLKNGEHTTARLCRVEYAGLQNVHTCSLIQNLQDSEVVAYELYRLPLRWARVSGIATRPTVPPIEGSSGGLGSRGTPSRLEDLSQADQARAVALFNDIEDFGHEFEAAFASKSVPAAETGTRRLLNLLSNYNAVVKGTGYEFSSGIFKDIGKVQQALKGGDWNKVQEAARGNDAYRQEFKRIAGRMVELARQQRPAGATSFGPVIERVVVGAGDKNRRFIDLDEGRLFAAAEYFGPKAEPSPAETEKWLRETGIDAVADTRAAYGGLVGFNMVAAPVPNEEWERLPPSGLDYYFAMTTLGTPVTMSGKGRLPATYAVKTREGGRGLLQIVWLSTNDPPTVKIRYKLVESARTNAAMLPLTASVRSLEANQARRYWRWQIKRPTPARLIYGVLDVTDPQHPQRVVTGMEGKGGQGTQDYALRVNPEPDKWKVEIEDAWAGENGGRGAIWEYVRCQTDATVTGTGMRPPATLTTTNYSMLWKGELAGRGGRTLKSLWFVARLAEADDPVKDILGPSDAVRTFDGKPLPIGP